MKINDALIEGLITTTKEPDEKRLEEILSCAKELKGISVEEALELLLVSTREGIDKIFHAAHQAKEQIYGKRMVLFAPLYISNLCSNECSYCAFRGNNQTLRRIALNMDQIRQETEAVIEEGHKRILLVSGETKNHYGLDYVMKAIETIYSVSKAKGNIRRINVNIAPLSVEDFKILHTANIGTYQLFQETYHEKTYKAVHLRGPKADYQFRLDVMDRAFEAGFEDVGIGALFGLYDHRFEVVSLLMHAKHLEDTFGVGPHTISIPRIEPAHGSDLSNLPPHAVSDEDFLRLIAVLRLAVPYTGLILSTRENPAIRRAAFHLGISQISAGSRTDPGGYTMGNQNDEQFSLGDTRSLHEVIEDLVQCGYIPSFCTGCYRLGRVGQDFMDLAKPGLIKTHCLPNAMFSFQEYLQDFAKPALKEKGEALIRAMMGDIEAKQSHSVCEILETIKKGERDVYF